MDARIHLAERYWPLVAAKGFRDPPTIEAPVAASRGLGSDGCPERFQTR